MKRDEQGTAPMAETRSRPSGEHAQCVPQSAMTSKTTAVSPTSRSSEPRRDDVDDDRRVHRELGAGGRDGGYGDSDQAA